MFSVCSNPCRRHGLTLIEVITSTALLATLLVSILVAHSKHGRLIKRDEQRLKAIEATDELVATWMKDGVLIPRTATGALPNTDFIWETEVVSREDHLGVEIIRLEVFDQIHAKPIISIDLGAPDSRVRPTNASN